MAMKTKRKSHWEHLKICAPGIDKVGCKCWCHKRKSHRQKIPFDCPACNEKKSVILGFGKEDLVCTKCKQRWAP